MLALFIFSRKNFDQFIKRVAQHNLKLAFIVALTATLGSLFYSDIAKFTPCILCWFQRIFMYPQAILLGIAAYKRDYGIKVYATALSLVGGAISVLHYYEQITYNPLIPCASVGYSVSCTERFVMTYGYITIPLMALTAFALIIFLLNLPRK